MPFDHHGNRSFTATSIDKNAPPYSGVYGLSDAREWLFVGETANIQSELRRHLMHPVEFLQGRRPSGFTFELCPEESRGERRNQLVKELSPAGNNGS